MSAYFVNGKGWRYDFTHKAQRITGVWYETKRDAKRAEARRKEELAKPQSSLQTPTDMAFLELVNRRLDHVQAYNSEHHYLDYRYMAKRWIQNWGDLQCSRIDPEMIERFVLVRASISTHVANAEIRYLRATFRFGQKKKWIMANPTDGIGFLPVEKTIRYVPSPEDVDRVIRGADRDTQDYLWTIRDTPGRVSEINRWTWNDVDLDGKCLVLHTRKQRGGHLTPRKVPLTGRLYGILARRYSERDPSKPWVFWHRYHRSKSGERREGPFIDRKRIMKTLCAKAGVQYFRFHALRHSGASVMDKRNVPIGTIERILGHENRTTTEIWCFRHLLLLTCFIIF
jgi:integrase